MLNLVLFGPPGAGKGTQSAHLIEKYGLIHLSTGDILRAERKAGTELGSLANAYIEKGELVPDEVIIGMVKKTIESYPSPQGFIFDGFPRTVPQAEALDTMLEEFNTSISAMLALEVPEEELIERLMERGKTSGRADDQNVEIIKNRIAVYRKETEPVAGFYDNQDKLFKINGLGKIEDILSRLSDAIEQVI